MEENLKNDIIDAVEEYNENTDERLFYDKELDDWKVRQSALDDARIDAKAEGKLEECISITKKLLEKDVSVSLIMEVTGLSLEEINKIRDSLK